MLCPRAMSQGASPKTTSASPYREAPSRPAPRRPPYWVLAAIALGCVGLLCVTTHKLYVMLLLRGDIEGIAPRLVVLGPSKQVWPNGVDLRVVTDPATHDPVGEIQVARGQASSVPSGAPISVRCRNGQCYAPESIYIDDDNLFFDEMLLAGETVGFAAALWGLARMRRRHLEALRGTQVRAVASV